MPLYQRILVIMILGAWIIWPDWFGLSSLIFNLAQTQLVPALLLTGAIALLVMTLLPLSLVLYKRGTQAVLLIAVVLFHYQARVAGILDLNWTTLMVTLGLSFIFVFVAWPMIANPLWQRTHYVRAVDGSDADDEGTH